VDQRLYAINNAIHHAGYLLCPFIITTLLFKQDAVGNRDYAPMPLPDEQDDAYPSFLILAH